MKDDWWFHSSTSRILEWLCMNRHFEWLFQHFKKHWNFYQEKESSTSDWWIFIISQVCWCDLTGPFGWHRKIVLVAIWGWWNTIASLKQPAPLLAGAITFMGHVTPVSVITLVKHIPKNSRVKVFANGISADYKERGDTHTHTKNRLFPPSFFGSNKEGTSREIWDHSAKGLVPINTADLLLDRCHEIEYRLYLLIPWDCCTYYS